MNRPLVVVCLSFLLILGIAPLGQAQTSAVYAWPEQLERADVVVVCLGTVTGIQIGERRGGIAEATVQVGILRVFKGPAALKKLTFTQTLEQDEPEPNVPADKYSIFFLRGQTDKNWFRLFMPCQSVIALGNSATKPVSPSLSPFRTISLLMADSLAGADEERRLELLASLHDALPLYLPQNPESAKLERSIGEPNGIKQFYDGQVVPLVEPYRRDQNSEVRRVAANIMAHR